MARFENDKSNTLVSGTSSDDYIWNIGSNVTISSGNGDDTVKNKYYVSYYPGSSVQIHTSDGNDSIYNDCGNSVTIDTGVGNDYVYNYNGDSVSINTGSGNDFVDNEYGDLVTIITDAGNDIVRNNISSVTINTGVGNDEVDNVGDSVTITGGNGNDTIFNNCYRKSDGSIYYYDDRGVNVMFKYNSGDGNDKIYGFRADSTLSIGGGSYSTKKSGDNVIVTVGTGKISLMGAASLSKVNIKGTKATSTTKTVTNSTKSPVTVGSAIKTINASKRTTAVKITGNANANTITGGSGKDSIYGGTGNDSILGNAGNDKLYGQAGNDKLYGGKGNDTLSGGKGNDSLWGNAGKDTFIYANGDGKDVIFGFENTDMLKITGKFSTSYNKSKGEIYFKVGSTANAITLKDFSATSFNVNGTNYKISGSKLVKK